MREPLYTLKDFATKIGVSHDTLLSRINKLGHELPEPVVLQKTVGNNFVKKTFKNTAKRYRLSDLYKWHNGFKNRNKDLGEDDEENKTKTT